MDSILGISIDPKLCLKTDSEILKELKLCLNCKKIPIPTLKTENEDSYCKTCFLSLNLDFKNLLIPIQNQKILDKLVVSCKNYKNGCQKEFSSKNLEDMLIHDCYIKENKELIVLEDLQKCLNNNLMTKSNLIKLIQDETIKKEINKIVNENILTQSVKLNDKIMILEEIIQSQNYNLIEMKETINNLQKELYNKDHKSQNKINELGTKISEENHYIDNIINTNNKETSNLDSELILNVNENLDKFVKL